MRKGRRQAFGGSRPHEIGQDGEMPGGKHREVGYAAEQHGRRDDEAEEVAQRVLLDPHLRSERRCRYASG